MSGGGPNAWRLFVYCTCSRKKTPDVFSLFKAGTAEIGSLSKHPGHLAEPNLMRRPFLRQEAGSIIAIAVMGGHLF